MEVNQKKSPDEGTLRKMFQIAALISLVMAGLGLAIASSKLGNFQTRAGLAVLLIGIPSPLTGAYFGIRYRYIRPLFWPGAGIIRGKPATWFGIFLVGIMVIFTVFGIAFFLHPKV